MFLRLYVYIFFPSSSSSLSLGFARPQIPAELLLSWNIRLGLFLLLFGSMEYSYKKNACICNWEATTVLHKALVDRPVVDRRFTVHIKARKATQIIL